MTAVVLRGDAAHLPLPDGSVDLAESKEGTAVTSPDPVVAALAARLKRAREDRGLSVRQVCEAAGITSKSVAWRAENGRDVAFSIAAKLAAALGVSLDGTVSDEANR